MSKRFQEYGSRFGNQQVQVKNSWKQHHLDQVTEKAWTKLWDISIYFYEPNAWLTCLTGEPWLGEVGWFTSFYVFFICHIQLKTIFSSFFLDGYGSIPINAIFRGMNIHLPAILMFTRGTRFWHTARYQRSGHGLIAMLPLKARCSLFPVSASHMCSWRWNGVSSRRYPGLKLFFPLKTWRLLICFLSINDVDLPNKSIQMDQLFVFNGNITIIHL